VFNCFDLTRQPQADVIASTMLQPGAFIVVVRERGVVFGQLRVIGVETTG
jgi:hypothetical protein